MSVARVVVEDAASYAHCHPRHYGRCRKWPHANHGRLCCAQAFTRRCERTPADLFWFCTLWVEVTLTQNDGSPELAAACRRDPFAIPDCNELVEYLLSRRKMARASAEQHSVFHVISYQRRLSFVKHDFFVRGHPSPLGNVADWWVGCPAACTWETYRVCNCGVPPTCQQAPTTKDRTEAQGRGALHSHILGVIFYVRCLVDTLSSPPHVIGKRAVQKNSTSVVREEGRTEGLRRAAWNSAYSPRER